MSVYTPVGLADLADWLPPCAVGEPLACRGIAAGVENSNFFVTTSAGEYVLTLFERLSGEALDFYLGLMAHLAGQGYPCPRPLPASDGRLWRPLLGKPAALVSRLSGVCIESVAQAHCRQVGQSLGQMHRMTSGYSRRLLNPRGAPWRGAVAQRLLPVLDELQAAQLRAELDFQAAQDYAALPQGIIHADLFRDNVLWEEERLNGILDFYFAGEDALLFDLAVAANDWCADAEAESVMLRAYEHERPLGPHEREAWMPMRRAAALRFWLSRLEDLHFPRQGSLVTVKDPAHFGAMLARMVAGC